MDLTKYELPNTVKVNGQTYAVKTSFKKWLGFVSLLKNKNTALVAFDSMYVGEPPASRLSGLYALRGFCSPVQVLPRSTGEALNLQLLDYELDSDLIYSAFMQQYRIDLMRSNMHWYKFQALLRGLQDTKLNEIIGIRMYENTSGKSDNYSRQMEKLQKAWELPQENELENDKDLQDFLSKLKG